MKIAWDAFWLGSRTWLKTGWLITAVLVAVSGGVIRPSRAFRGIAMEKTAAITVSLHSEAETNVFGLHWRPLYELKLAAMQGVEGLSDYATAMVSLVFYLPAILLWLATILAGAFVGWKLLRFGRERSLRQKTPKAYLSRHRSG